MKVEEDKKLEINQIDSNETYLDQTTNFNASLEKLSNLKEKSNESVVLLENDVIDCSKFDEDDDDNNDVNNEPIVVEDEVEESTDLQIEIEENLNEENLTVINPEQINLVNEIPTESRSEINLNEKFKDISSKMPNYFLEENDLESKMKKLHQDYAQVSIFELI